MGWGRGRGKRGEGVQERTCKLIRGAGERFFSCTTCLPDFTAEFQEGRACLSEVLIKDRPFSCTTCLLPGCQHSERCFLSPATPWDSRSKEGIVSLLGFHNIFSSTRATSTVRPTLLAAALHETLEPITKLPCSYNDGAGGTR